MPLKRLSSHVGTSYLLQLLLVTALYFATGRLGLLLSTDNGYSTLVWPPSGIAIAAVILFGFRIWPALFLGALITNLTLGESQGSVLQTLMAQPQNITIALGNSTQALLAVLLLKRLHCFDVPLTRLRDILKFYLLAGPLACLVAASVGTASLYYFGIIPEAAIGSTWGTWWVGDTNGVLLITPFIIAWRQPASQTRLDRRLSVSVGLLLIFSILVIFVRQLQAWNHDGLVNQLEEDLQATQNVFSNTLQEAIRADTSLVSFITLTENLDSATFQRFATEGLGRTDGVVSMSWNKMVPAADRAPHDAYLKETAPNERASRFGIWQLDPTTGEPVASRQTDYHVYVRYLAPYEVNKDAIGFDVWSGPNRRDTMRTAILSGDPAVTERINLVQFNTDAAGVLMYAPVYNEDRTVRGIATSVLRISALVDKVRSIHPIPDLQLSLYDLSAKDDRALLYADSTDADPRWQSLTMAAPLPFADRQWQLRLTPTDSYVFSYSEKSSWLAILATWISAAALAILLLVLTGAHYETERQIAERTQELRLANRAKSDFLANMSHEIRTPMNGVLGVLGILENSGLTADQQHLVKVSQQSAQTLLAVINDILDFSKLEKGELQLHEGPTCLQDVIEAALTLLAPGAEAKNLTLKTDFDCRYLGYVIIDGVRLQQVLFNVIGNAIKFTDEGTVTISLLTEQADDGTVDVSITVADTGIGIADTDQEKIFERFKQIEDASNRRFQGTGLGLAISKQIMTLLGGNLSLASQKDAGTTITIAFTGLTSAAKPQTTTHTPAADSKGQSRQLNIWVAEDNPVNQMIVRKMLEQFGHACRFAGNGKELLAQLDGLGGNEPQPDLILMDIQMPEMDGVTATREIRKRADALATIPIVALTANVLPEQHAEYMRAGVNDCISKPIQFTEFFDKIAHQLGLEIADIADRRT